jgi:putative Holliday junction resolvase
MEMKTPIAPGRRIGFDYGEKRIGVATSDSESILVSPHATIKNDADLSLKISEILNDVRPVYIVIGNPKHLSGVDGSKSYEAASFAALIRSLYEGPIYLVDERLSTQVSYAQMRDAGKSARDSKSVIDQIAAVNILETALLNEKSNTSIGNRF